MSVTSERPRTRDITHVDVQCSTCPRTYTVTAATAAHHRRGVRQPRCVWCRNSNPDTEKQDSLEAYWKERFTTEQIIELAQWIDDRMLEAAA